MSQKVITPSSSSQQLGQLRPTGIWMPLYIGDYFADTAHLSTQGHGAYLLLMMAYWRRGGALPDDDKFLAGICKVSPKGWGSLKKQILPLFRLEGGYLISDFLENQILKSSARSAAGVRANSVRWQSGVPSESHRNPSHSKSKSNSTSSLRSSLREELRSEGAGPSSVPEPEPPQSLPRHAENFEDVPDDIPFEDDTPPPPPKPPARLWPVQVPPVVKPLQQPDFKTWAYGRAKEVCGPKGGPIMTKLIKLFGKDVLKLHHVLGDAERAAGEPTQYLFGVIAKETARQKVRAKEDEELAAWKPKGTYYPPSDERGFYMVSKVTPGKRLYLDPDRVQQLVGTERDRMGVG